MAGCDFVPHNIPGIGIVKALELMEKYPGDVNQVIRYVHVFSPVQRLLVNPRVQNSSCLRGSAPSSRPC